MLKKPSQLFESKNSSKEVPAPVRTTTPLMSNFNETFDRFKNNLDKVEELNEKINIITENLSTKLSKEDLEGAIFSHLLVVEENFRELETQFKDISKKSLREFKADVAQLTEVVQELVEEELPDYKKKVTETEIKISQQFNSLQENVENNLVAIEENLHEKLEGFGDSIENVLSGFDTTLQETKSDVLETIETYNKLRKILENKVLNDEDKIGKYSQILEDFNQRFVEFESSVSSQVEDYEKTFSSIVEQLNESIENKFDTYDNVIEVFKEEVNKNVLDIKADVVINEQHLKKVEKYLQENHQELIDLKEEVFGELEKITYGDIQENVERLNKKIQYIEEVYKNIEPEVIVKEVIQEGLLNEPPSTKNSDPLTPLDQNFVTLDQLQQHYRLFLNRIQQQLATLGGGGETRLKYLDDIVGIATNASAYDGKFLKYNHSLGKFEFETITIPATDWESGANGPYTLDKVGIGTSVAQYDLDVNGDINLNGTFYQNGSPFVASRWTAGTGDDIYRLNGNVGVGLTNPSERLDVSGNIKLTGAIYGPSVLEIDPAITGDNTGAVRIRGDLYVDGTQTTINSTSVEVADYQVSLASSITDNIVLDGAGIGIGSSGIRKTITWNNSSSALTSSEDWNLASGKQYHIGGVPVLSSNTLGSGVTNSSLTSVGTLDHLNVSGVGTFQSSNLKIRNPANTFQYSIVGSAIATDRSLTLPLLTANDTVAVLGLPQTFTQQQTFSSVLSSTNLLTASGQLFLTGSATLSHFFATNQTSATIAIGGTAGTGALTLGQSTNTQITNVQAGTSGVGTTKTINLGTGGLSGSFTQINIGPTAGVGTVVINSGTRLGIGSTLPTQALDVRGNVVVSGFSSVTDTRLNSVAEETTIGVGNTINLVYNTGGGNIGIITSPSGPITLNITGIPTDSSFDNRSLTFSVMVNQGASVAYACSSITLNGVTPTIRWPGGVVAVGATSSYDIFNFTCINPIGSASTTTNYVVLGVLNGNFR